MKSSGTQTREALLHQDRLAYNEEVGKKAVVSYPPRYVTMTVTNRCSNRCAYCGYHSVDAKNVSNVYGLKFDIEPDLFKRLINFFYEGRVPHVHICATGDPFYHPNIVEFIDYAIQVYGTTSLQTSFPKVIFQRNNYTEALLERADKLSYITTDLFSGIQDDHACLKTGSDLGFTLDQIEFVCRHSSVPFRGHFILTRSNYTSVKSLIDVIARRKLRCSLEVVNLHSHGFNEATSPEQRYIASDTHITEYLEGMKEYAEQQGVSISVAAPSDQISPLCNSFWGRLQLWPVKGCNMDRAAENMIIGGCNAVVRGKLNSLGYVFDYDNIMSMWNNPRLVEIRQMFLNGEYPDEYCKACRYL